MLMQQDRSLPKNHIMAGHRPMTAGRVATQRVAPNRHAPQHTFTARRGPQVEPQSSGTLLPWADPYIADLQRRHEGELRRERIEARVRS